MYQLIQKFIFYFDTTCNIFISIYFRSRTLLFFLIEPSPVLILGIYMLLILSYIATFDKTTNAFLFDFFYLFLSSIAWKQKFEVTDTELLSKFEVGLLYMIMFFMSLPELSTPSEHHIDILNLVLVCAWM